MRSVAACNATHRPPYGKRDACVPPRGTALRAEALTGERPTRRCGPGGSHADARPADIRQAGTGRPPGEGSCAAVKILGRLACIANDASTPRTASHAARSQPSSAERARRGLQARARPNAPGRVRYAHASSVNSHSEAAPGGGSAMPPNAGQGCVASRAASAQASASSSTSST
jgi:hypothetical protein